MSQVAADAIDRLATQLASQFEEQRDCAEQLKLAMEHIAMHVHCVCKNKYGLSDPWGEEDPEREQSDTPAEGA